MVVHTGSRHLGKQIAEFYQKKAAQESAHIVNRALAYIQGKSFDEYLNDMAVAQRFAALNREAIADVVINKMDLKTKNSFSTVHNYIDLDSMILRKGAVSAKKDEVLLIPISMNAGSIIAIGKGNPDWNMSAPHGAGRIMSRRQARKTISLAEFKKSMQNVYSSSVTKDTIDEAPFAYKSMEAILSKINETVSVRCIIRPLYNFKASGD